MHAPLNSLPEKDLVLIGGGYAHLHVLREWRTNPLPGVRLTVISPDRELVYSGMLPGVMAGLYSLFDATLDLQQLCTASGTRLIAAAANGLNPAGRVISLVDRPPIPFDLVSIAVGSIPQVADGETRSGLISLKPLRDFPQRWEQAVRRLRPKPLESIDVSGSAPLKVVMVGGGAAGCEMTLALDRWLNLHKVNAEIRLVESGPEILGGGTLRTIQRMRHELHRRGIQVETSLKILGVRTAGVEDPMELQPLWLEVSRGADWPADLVVWATSGGPPPLLSRLGLPLDEQGFLMVDPTLQSVSGLPVFAAGDAAALRGVPLPKAGVHAVRQGALLWGNVRRYFRGEPLQPYRAGGFLSLISLGDGRALGNFRGWSFEGGWVWRWKDRIDRRFLEMNRPAGMNLIGSERRGTGVIEDPQDSMRCTGCGSKVPAEVLSDALKRLACPSQDGTLGTRITPDDAVVIDRQRLPVDVFSVDFFPAFLDDPYLFGRIAVLHALSDLWAMGARPVGAQALVTLPPGSVRQQGEMLFQLLAGGLRELQGVDAELWGGHTTEGAELQAGFSVAGCLDGQPPLRKSALLPGDFLILTKPLGVGVVLATLRMGRGASRCQEEALRFMLQSNASAAWVAREVGCTAATDVTGFGLAGHLLEMLEASRVSARLSIGEIPRISGAESLLRGGVTTSLGPSNRRRVESRLRCQGSSAGPDLDLLFDPQTSGGLLLGVSASQVDRALELLRSSGAPDSCVVGKVEACAGPDSDIALIVE
ncbi:MAG: selenide, water dikinase SelD [Planctomycetaceae bacterium]